MFQFHFENDPFKELREEAKEIASKSISINLDQAMAPISAQLKEMRERIESISIELNFEKYQTLFETIEQETKNIPDRVDTIYSYLAQRGWFIPFHFAGLNAFKRYESLIENKKHKIIEKELQKYIKDHQKSFKLQAERYFPKRFKILSSAFDAHDNEQYELSIPVFLAQADGMFVELIETTFYSNDKDILRKTKANLLEKLAKNGHPKSTNSLGYLLLKQFAEKSLLHESFEEIEKRKNNDPELNPLNRNTILHGRDIEYANEANSLRTIALIGLLSNCKDSFQL